MVYFHKLVIADISHLNFHELLQSLSHTHGCSHSCHTQGWYVQANS